MTVNNITNYYISEIEVKNNIHSDKNDFKNYNIHDHHNRDIVEDNKLDNNIKNHLYDIIYKRIYKDIEKEGLSKFILKNKYDDDIESLK